MEKLHQYLSVFRWQLAKIDEGNMVLGGSQILELHGLRLGWEPQDLDVVVFMPNCRQIKLITEELHFEPCADYRPGKDHSIPERVRSWELTKEGLKLNVILAYDEYKPQNLLVLNYGARYLVNSISNIIAAKLSYAAGEKKQYLRAKDMAQLTMLKNNNFNVDMLPEYIQMVGRGQREVSNETPLMF